MRSSKSIALVALLGLMATTLGNPVRRAQDLEARRRSAIDRSLIRFGRSYPPEPSAAEIMEKYDRPTRAGNSFLRFGRSDELYALLKQYEQMNPPKRGAGFIRLGRDPKFIRLGRDPSFIRLGRSGEEDKSDYDQGTNMLINGFPQRKNRARDHFIRLGRDREENEEEPMMGNESKSECDDCES